MRAPARLPRLTLSLTCTWPLLGAGGCARPDAAPPTAPPVAPVALVADADGDPRFDAPFAPVPADVPEPPSLRPSSLSPDTFPITTNAYGAFRGAPDAPEQGELAADFRVALASGGTFDLGEARAAGPVLLMFYRGFW